MTSPSATPRLVQVPYGRAAVRALADAVAAAQADSPLAPVDVVVPSALTGMTVRRALAQPGLANVRFSSLPQLAERLALRQLALAGRRPLTAAAGAVALRRAAGSTAGPLAAAAAHPQTEGLLQQLFSELDEAEAVAAGAVPRLRSRGSGPAGVAELYEAYRREVGDALDPAAVARAGAEAVRVGSAPLTSVVLYAPRRLSPAEQDLLAALAEQSRLTAVLCQPADERTRAALAAILGPATDMPAADETTRAFLVAPDAEEEVRLVVRRIVAELHERPRRPERIGVGYRSSTPYTRLLAEQLSAAGLPHHVPGGRTLTETVAGRVLLGLLDLERADYPRSELVTWLSDAPLRDTRGSAVPVARWDRLSRDAGVSRGLQTWHDRIGTACARTQSRLDESEDDDRRARYRHRVESLQELLAFVERTATYADAALRADSWGAVAAALRSALESLLGGRRAVERWGRELGGSRDVSLEQSAYEAVLTAVDALAALDDVAAPPSPAFVRSALRRALDRSAGARTTLGRGIVVAPLRDLAGADLDLLLLVGLTEDALPARVREHPLLRDDDRKAADCGLLTVHDRREQDRRDFQASLAAADRVVLSFPWADTRAQRRQHPSPWFVEQVQAQLDVERDAGQPRTQVFSGDVLQPGDRLPVQARASFVEALALSSSLVSPAEHDLALAMSGQGDRITDARYQRGRLAVQARRDGVFGAWTGHVGPLPEPLATKAETALSASSLQGWATCPHTFWLERILGVRDLETTDDDVIDPLRRGSLVHEVLERFFADHLGTVSEPGRAPDDAWSKADVRRARQLLDEGSAALEAEGRTGRPLLWRAERARLSRQLARILAVDSRMRAARRSWPIAVELPFGRDGKPALELVLPSAGAVSFAGFVDRVDATEDGGLVVVDYKTGKGFGYEVIPLADRPDEEADLVDRGRKLQLVLYALAAQRAYAPPTRSTSSYYWFVELGAVQRGAAIGSREEQRLLEVLDIAVRGIREGVYPAHPGDWDGWSGWGSCSFCPYDRACSSTRGEVWLQISTADPVSAYAELASGGPRA